MAWIFDIMMIIIVFSYLYTGAVDAVDATEVSAPGIANMIR